MTGQATILGIDVGSVALTVAETSLDGEVLQTAYRLHQGRVADTFSGLLREFDAGRVRWTAATTSTPAIFEPDRHFDNRLALIEAARCFHDRVGSILVVGGEAFGLIGFDRDGRYRSFRTNTGCAAGTGSFLDQQARRLHLESSAALGELASRNMGPVPKIASRCAVFAKTDLVHAQQEGYSLEQICDGLCRGLARNIVDTLSMERELSTPVVFTGGVSRNRAVIRHLEDLTGTELAVDPSGAFGAIGAAFLLAAAVARDGIEFGKPLSGLLVHRPVERRYFHPPLNLERSSHPDFGGTEQYEFTPQGAAPPDVVEVTLYQALAGAGTLDVCFGLDIGSTSTKAVLLDPRQAVLAGLYTGTAGRPVAAVQRLLASVEDLAGRKGVGLRITGCAVTGAGRKFGGRIVGADLVLDEITAHARAALHLDPKVDTIIEIGGQDSKFTTLENGRVTFSAMNSVCAAGTGSFIEEQARKLDCTLAEFSARSENRLSPMVSDRCTVFMERDMNQCLSDGYAVDEVLASVLHAITENYLTKVAVEGMIGTRVAFQGATARNRSLVAAFEQRLQKPIHVSRFCHLTGALGAALALLDGDAPRPGETRFRGLDLHRNEVAVTSEVCDLCANHCKITVAEFGGETAAYGFLCGRDYETKRFVDGNRSGFDLLRERRKAFAFEPAAEYDEEIAIGLPAAVHLFEDLPFWKHFFNGLGIRTVTSEEFGEAFTEGRHLAGAEFCAPMTSLHGHVEHLLDRADYVFLPVYLEQRTREKHARRHYCYYTQFASPLAFCSAEAGRRGRLLSPLIRYLYNPVRTRIELHAMLKPITRGEIGILDVVRAWEAAAAHQRSGLEKLKQAYRREAGGPGRLKVVLLGRPYTALSRRMNKGIPDILASFGVKVFFQDMLSPTDEDLAPLGEVLGEMHWHYTAEILKAAQAAARTEGLYPVLVTSFRCSPDSFVIDEVRKILQARGKPYLVLQLDEHESNLGYETRIEAAIRSFESHLRSGTPRTSVAVAPLPSPKRRNGLEGKTLVIPNWDEISLTFITAGLRREGIDARLLEETEATIQKSLRRNTGQCIPLDIIAQDFIDYVEAHQLDPAQTVLWVADSKIACNIGLYPRRLRDLIHAQGNGLEQVEVHAGPVSFIDISLKLPVNTYLAYLFGGHLRKIGCRLRPYETVPGTTDRALERGIGVLVEAFLGKRRKDEALAEVIAELEAVIVRPGRKPKVAIFGDIYVRDNRVLNQDLIRFIEAHGGEVLVTPYSSYVRMVADTYLRKWFTEGRYLSILSTRALIATVSRLEKTYLEYFRRVVDEPEPVYGDDPAEILAGFNVLPEHTGESMDNLLKIHYTMKHHPDVSLFVQASPAFCCASLITEAMAREIERKTGVPVVSITYDGTTGRRNEAIIPYLALK
jgi:predicted CoA-substrate-specific enzyme activase